MIWTIMFQNFKRTTIEIVSSCGRSWQSGNRALLVRSWLKHSLHSVPFFQSKSIEVSCKLLMHLDFIYFTSSASALQIHSLHSTRRLHNELVQCPRPMKLTICAIKSCHSLTNTWIGGQWLYIRYYGRLADLTRFPLF